MSIGTVYIVKANYPDSDTEILGVFDNKEAAKLEAGSKYCMVYEASVAKLAAQGEKPKPIFETA